MVFRENDSDILYKGLLSHSDEDSSDPPSARLTWDQRAENCHDDLYPDIRVKCGLVVSVYLSTLMPLSSSGLGTNTAPPSLTSQMQELEQRLLEAEQRAEDAETQVTGCGGQWESARDNDLPTELSVLMRDLWVVLVS